MMKSDGEYKETLYHVMTLAHIRRKKIQRKKTYQEQCRADNMF